jgi:alpha-amylase/alpha-mannosidase (GH57 family)
MEKFICIHGHFYQPPRENPWLEAVELQDSASPYHDWNARITAECYAPNATARILQGDGRICDMISTYSKMSFNFGPTLLSWMKDKMPEVHDAIVEADKQSREYFGGHGSAIAQNYNHMIMPLAHPRDKETQVIWGIKDFEFRFGRKPEGMWLAETGVDTETLEVLARHGIKFTILSPYQASRMRESGKRHWKDVNGAKIDPTRPYLYRLPSKQTIALFFYDAPVSQAVAFEKLLETGEKFAGRLTSAFNDQRQWDQLVHIATDGESYGHHHRYGEMALAYALRHIESNNLARLTVYGEYLEKHQPTLEVQIHEKSAWSCSHGVGRWMENCGCNSGGREGWNQEWRTPLRQALDWLRDQLAPEFEQKARDYLKNPWAARNDYISVILDRSEENVAAFMQRNASRELNEQEQVTVIKLMEMQRHAMLMYTSCGWFFDEVSGLESVQVAQYAGRAMQIAQDVLQKNFEEGFLNLFQNAKSNIPEHCDGRCIYDKFVKPAMVDWDSVAAHYGVTSIFHNHEKQSRIFLYEYEDIEHEMLSAGRSKLSMGTVKLRFDVTRETAVRSYAVLYLGEHNLSGAVGTFPNPEAYKQMCAELKEAFERADYPETIRLMDRHFGRSTYSLKSLFKDDQRRILDEILRSTREDLESRFRSIAERYTPLMKFLRDMRVPLPDGLEMASNFSLRMDIGQEFAKETPDAERLKALVQEAKDRNVNVWDEYLSYAVKTRLEALLERLAHEPGDPDFTEQVANVAGIVQTLPLDINWWRVQHTFWKTLQNSVPEFQERARHGDEHARRWLEQFRNLGEQLRFAPNLVEVPEVHHEPELAAVNA